MFKVNVKNNIIQSPIAVVLFLICFNLYGCNLKTKPAINKSAIHELNVGDCFQPKSSKCNGSTPLECINVNGDRTSFGIITKTDVEVAKYETVVFYIQSTDMKYHYFVSRFDFENNEIYSEKIKCPTDLKTFSDNAQDDASAKSMIIKFNKNIENK